ncbi:MAG: glutathione S-transferase N-terminal domain-containing protein [Alphaproteobacteria bacterium]
MILYSFPSSPFGCKVKAVILACGLEKAVEIKEFHPWLPDVEFRLLNPLGKIPVLQVEDDAIFDSRVICEYLMEKSGMLEKLMPDRIKSLKIQALVDGIADAAVAIRYELFFRPVHLRCLDWHERQQLALVSGLEYLNKSSLSMDIRFDNLCIVMLLSYLEFRFADAGFENTFKNLYEWYYEFMKNHPFLKDSKAKDHPVPSGITRLEK